MGDQGLVQRLEQQVVAALGSLAARGSGFQAQALRFRGGLNVSPEGYPVSPRDTVIRPP